MDKIDPVKKRLTPYQMLSLGYVLITVAGAVLLSLPISSAKGTCQPFVDALFVSTSGISTSGLSVVDIGTYYSFFGQIVLMCIFQIGGVGYMTFFIFTAYMIGTKISLTTGIVAKESLAVDTYHMLGRFFRNVFFFTFIFEFIGAVALTIFWMGEYSFWRSVYLGIFHSISAFCTAGFSTFSSSLMNYKSSIWLNLVINAVSITGGIGFFVLIDMYKLYAKRKEGVFPRRLSLHSRIALLVTFFVMTIGAVIIFAAEKWPASVSLLDRAMISFFQSISASTTDGFNSIDIGGMSAASLSVLMVLMFIGASPGSTGGGMKTTTFGTLCMLVKTYITGQKVVAFERKVPLQTILKAFTIFSLFCAIAFIDMIILVNVEKASYTQILFEITSALGNTGLSTGITPNLTILGKIVLIITMFIGRVGPLTIGTAMITRAERRVVKYPVEDIFIG